MFYHSNTWKQNMEVHLILLEIKWEKNPNTSWISDPNIKINSIIKERCCQPFSNCQLEVKKKLRPDMFVQFEENLDILSKTKFLYVRFIYFLKWTNNFLEKKNNFHPSEKEFGYFLKI